MTHKRKKCHGRGNRNDIILAVFILISAWILLSSEAAYGKDVLEETVRTPSEAMLNGVKIKTKYTWAGDTPQEVYQFYKKTWEAEGIRTTGGIREDSAHISALSRDGREIVTVTAIRRGKGSLLIFSRMPLVSELWAGRPGSDIPSLEGSEGFVTHEDIDKNGKRRKIITYYNKATISANVAFLKKKLEELGWNFKSHNEDREGSATMLVFENMNHSLLIVVSHREDKALTAVMGVIGERIY